MHFRIWTQYFLLHEQTFLNGAQIWANNSPIVIAKSSLLPRGKPDQGDVKKKKLIKYPAVQVNVNRKNTDTAVKTSRTDLLLLTPFACTSKIKEITPEPWSSSPELYSHSWCTQGPSTGSTLCRTRSGSTCLTKSREFPASHISGAAICQLSPAFLHLNNTGFRSLALSHCCSLISLFIVPSHHHLVLQHLV